MHITASLRFVYRLLALLMLMTVWACGTPTGWMGLGGEEESPAAKAAAAAQEKPAEKQPPKPAAPATPAPASSSTPPATPAPAQGNQGNNGFAPPSHINNEPPPPAPVGVYALPTNLGEGALKNVPTVKVALLVPLTGASADVGKSFLDAGVLALYDKYNALSTHETTAKVELLPKDTGDTIEGAEKAAQDAIQEGATLILGPVYSKQVSVVASSARHQNIPVITFSNNMAVAGEGVYLFGFVPEQQVVRIVQYSLGHNITNIAALVPSDPYGAAIVKQLSQEMRKHNGRIYPVEYYSEDMQALDNNVGRLSRFIQDEGTKNQALFIAEGGKKLKTLTDTLVANGISANNVQMLGTGLWDDPELLKWPNVNGGWFASSPPEKYTAFEQHFMTTYSYRPERRSSLAYDATALAVNLALSSSGKGFPTEKILDPVGFNGPANGIFRFHDDGSVERGLAVLMVTPAGFKTIDPAPTMFNQ
ncbi:MAG TPA: penicillin-binding protein activator [Rickettsiales bacterium]|nr:penicillin-binding protein activator [Rickettsiales bacterium]